MPVPLTRKPPRSSAGRSGGHPAGDIRRHRIGQPPPARPDPPLRQVQRPDADLRRCLRSLLGLPPTRQAPQAACQTARPSSSPVRSHRPAVRSGTRRGGPAHRLLGQRWCGGHRSARRRDSLGTSPASNLTAMPARANSARPGKSARRDSYHAGAACRPGWRAPLICQRRLKPAMALPNVFALTGRVS
jgi:hypothetical protein